MFYRIGSSFIFDKVVVAAVETAAIRKLSNHSDSFFSLKEFVLGSDRKIKLVSEEALLKKMFEERKKELVCIEMRFAECFKFAFEDLCFVL